MSSSATGSSADSAAPPGFPPSNATAPISADPSSTDPISADPSSPDPTGDGADRPAAPHDAAPHDAAPRDAAAEADDAARQRALKARGTLPRHVAIIMDGNGRWARARDQVRVAGHHEGVVSVRTITEACVELGVECLTLYTFSTENWHRPQAEVEALMRLLVRTIERERDTLIANGVALRVIGDADRLPPDCREALEATMAATQANSRMRLHLALSYSGRWDLTQAVRRLARAVAEGTLAPDAIDEAAIDAQLATAGAPDPDLLIRTGGEYRLSNFLLWQAAYTELYVTDCFWPDFRRRELYRAIRSFQDRERRFGRVEPASP